MVKRESRKTSALAQCGRAIGTHQTTHQLAGALSGSREINLLGRSKRCLKRDMIHTSPARVISRQEELVLADGALLQKDKALPRPFFLDGILSLM